MRTTAVSVVLVTAIATGCATGSAPRAAPEVGLGQPAPRGAASDPRAGNALAHELSEQGRAALAGGDAAAAASSLREAVRLQPDLIDARESLGLALYQMGD